MNQEGDRDRSRGSVDGAGRSFVVLGGIAAFAGATSAVLTFARGAPPRVAGVLAGLGAVLVLLGLGLQRRSRGPGVDPIAELIRFWAVCTPGVVASGAVLLGRPGGPSAALFGVWVLLTVWWYRDLGRNPNGSG